MQPTELYTRLIVNCSSGPIYESANFHNRRLMLLLMCSLADVRENPGELTARLGSGHVLAPQKEKTVIGSNRTNLACIFLTRPHIFNEIDVSLKSIWG